MMDVESSVDHVKMMHWRHNTDKYVIEGHPILKKTAIAIPTIIFSVCDI